MASRISSVCLVFLFWFFSPAGIAAQNAKMDSMIALLETDIPDSTKFYIYTQVVWANSVNNTDRAVALNDQLLSMALANDNDKWKIQAHYSYGVIYKNSGALEMARSHMDTVYQSVFEKKDTAMIAYSTYQMGVILNRMDRYTESIEFYNKAEQYYRYINNMSSVGMTMNSKAGVYKSMKLYEKAVDTYLNSLEFHKSTNDSIGISNVYANMANLYSELDSFDLALEFYQKQEDLSIALNNEWGMGYLYENRGHLYAKMGRLDDAITSIQKSVEIRRRFKSEELLATTLILLGSTEVKKGNLRIAEKIYFRRSSAGREE